MAFTRQILGALLTTFLFSLSWAQPTGQNLSQEIDKILKASKLKSDDFGIFIGSTQEEPLYQRNAHRLLIPASITKLLTTGAVLQNFLPGTKFKTQLLADTPSEGKTLKGSLYLKGGGDPSFVSETLWVLVNNFLRTGIRKIEGDIVVDDSLFDQQRFDTSRQKERVDRAFDAPTGAMSFNWNSMNIFVRPGKKEGDRGDVYLDPENEYLRLEQKVKTVKAGKKNSVSAGRDEDAEGAGDRVVVSGQVAVGSPEVVIFKNILQPDLWSGFNLKSFLFQRGIQVSGSIRAGPAPRKAELLAEVDSKPIEQILADMNKFSNNYVAEMLTKQLGTLKSTPGTIASGLEVIREFLKNIGIEKDEVTILNPSGFTRENRITPAALWKVLKWIHQQFRLEPEFTSSLPIAGVDGTLKKRMKETKAERSVRAKTGLLNGVASLAGYAGRKDGEVIPFVMIYNGGGDDSQARHTLDQILVQVVDSP